jgi:hypothetical protein
VTGESAAVDTQTNQVGTNYDKDWVRNAPVPRFSMFDLLAAAPGISQSSQGSTLMSAFGSGTDENTFQIDGTNLTSSATGGAWPYPNTDAIEEIEVLSLGAPAEFGNLTGAVMNIVTRQGTNTFHGDANFYFQSDGLTSRNTTDEEDGGFPFHREHFYDVTGSSQGRSSGQLRFFVSYRYQTDARTPAPWTFFSERAHRVFGKLNWQVSPSCFPGLSQRLHKLPAAPSANSALTRWIRQQRQPDAEPGVPAALPTRPSSVRAGFWGHDHFDPGRPGRALLRPRTVRRLTSTRGTTTIRTSPRPASSSPTSPTTPGREPRLRSVCNTRMAAR